MKFRLTYPRSSVFRGKQLHICLLGLAASSGLAYSDVPPPGQLVNYDGTYEGEIVIDAPAVNGQSGAVVVTQADINTILTGNITINSSIDNAESSSPLYGHGVRINDAGTGSSILLSTADADDAIKINVYDYVGSGVRTGSGTVILDATSSTKQYGIEIALYNKTDMADKTQEAAGIYSHGGRVEVKCNSLLTSEQARGYGLWVDQDGEIEITGNTEIRTSGNGSYGIRGGTPGGSATGSLIHHGNLTITTTGDNSNGTSNIIAYGADGIRMQANTTLTIDGKTSINTSGLGGVGIYGLDNAVIIAKDVDITTTGNKTASSMLKVGSHGIYAVSKSSISAEKVNIATEGNEAYGVYTSGGAITTGDTVITTKNSTTAAYGMYATGGSITTAKATIETKGTSAHAIYATNGTVTINDDLDVNTANANGIHTNGANGKVYLNGANNKIRVSGTDTRVIYAQNGLIEGIGKYDFISGTGIFADKGTVDLTMQAGTSFNGFTAFQSGSSTGNINLSLKENSIWTLSQNSKMTSIDVEAGSALGFNIFDQLTNTSITTTTATMADGAIVYIDISAYNPVVNDKFYLVNAGTYNISGDGVLFRLSEELSEGIYLYTGDFHIDGSITFVDLEPIPEPLTAALGLLGMGLLIFPRRRQQG